ncbi:ABC transporter ATP-binding protein [Chromatium okenii]|uniref:ABC transporter ATP-binding protein n=1 Tax=Chromatium okenii TaxID=61644 RepID=UPI0026EE7519|nr:ATP-binding cassette domain-containing protein [Chromatium okenii]MBV5308799.1 ATP-binding cassette domain-containing protein [Chromatium okenii]
MAAAAPAIYTCRELVKRRGLEKSPDAKKSPQPPFSKGGLSSSPPLEKGGQGGISGFELYIPSLTIRPCAVVVLRGASGCGKSTLLDLLALALRPDAAATFNLCPEHRQPTDVMRLWSRNDFNGLGRLRGAEIGYILQTGGLLPFLTARENIALPGRLLRRKPAGRIERLAERLNITAQLQQYPAQLSVGERQRVAIARALAHRPSVILADEPTASVDPVNAATIRQLLLELVQKSGLTAIIAAHDWPTESLPGVTFAEHRIERHGDLTRSLFWN